MADRKGWTYFLTGKSGYAWTALAASVFFGLCLLVGGVWEIIFMALGAILFIGGYVLGEGQDRFDFWMSVFIGSITAVYVVGWFLR